MYRLDGQFCIKFSVVDCFFIYTLYNDRQHEIDIKFYVIEALFIYICKMVENNVCI